MANTLEDDWRTKLVESSGEERENLEKVMTKVKQQATLMSFAEDILHVIPQIMQRGRQTHDMPTIIYPTLLGANQARLRQLLGRLDQIEGATAFLFSCYKAFGLELEDISAQNVHTMPPSVMPLPASRLYFRPRSTETSESSAQVIDTIEVSGPQTEGSTIPKKSPADPGPSTEGTADTVAVTFEPHELEVSESPQIDSDSSGDIEEEIPARPTQVVEAPMPPFQFEEEEEKDQQPKGKDGKPPILRLESPQGQAQPPETPSSQAQPPSSSSRKRRRAQPREPDAPPTDSAGGEPSSPSSRRSTRRRRASSRRNYNTIDYFENLEIE